MSPIQAHDTVLLISEEGKRYLVQLTPGDVWHSNRGRLAHDGIISQEFGVVVATHLGQKLLALRPTTADLMQHLKRSTQIVYPKDAAQLVLELDLWDGRRLIEAGTGSGGLTLAFARAVLPHGRVYSYELREEHQRQARRNLEQLGLLPYVELKLKDITEGFDETGVDAVFLDVRDPAPIVPHVQAALCESGLFGALLPTVTQASELLAALQAGDFVDIRMQEILLRPWKTEAARLRPADRMIAHTGYLIFARKLAARHRLFWMDSRQKRRAVEFGAWPVAATPSAAE